jgi:hypothetical protein
MRPTVITLPTRSSTHVCRIETVTTFLLENQRAHKKLTKRLLVGYFYLTRTRLLTNQTSPLITGVAYINTKALIVSQIHNLIQYAQDGSKKLCALGTT